MKKRNHRSKTARQPRFRRRGDYAVSIDADGNKTYYGPGDDKLCIYADGSAGVFEHVSFVNARNETLCLLDGVRKRMIDDVRDRINKKPPGAPTLTLADVADYKHESLAYLEALRQGDAAFLRAVAEMLDPTPQKAGKRAEAHADKSNADTALYVSITDAAAKVGGRPSLADSLAVYRIAAGKPSEPPSKYLRMMEMRGIAWMIRPQR